MVNFLLLQRSLNIGHIDLVDVCKYTSKGTYSKLKRPIYGVLTLTTRHTSNNKNYLGGLTKDLSGMIKCKDCYYTLTKSTRRRSDYRLQQ